jgi:hypothetical protein
MKNCSKKFIILYLTNDCSKRLGKLGGTDRRHFTIKHIRTSRERDRKQEDDVKKVNVEKVVNL